MKNFLKKRRGVSQIIGTLFMLAIVVAFGSLLLLQAFSGVSNFEVAMQIFSSTTTKKLQESITIDHVRFDPEDTNKNVTVWVRNNGIIEVVIDRITIVKTDTQELITKDIDLTNQIFVEEIEGISFIDGDVTLPSGCTKWNCDYDANSQLKDSQYRITVTTTFGNTISIIAQPYNT